MQISQKYNLNKAVDIVKKYNFKTVTLQFPDEMADICIDIFDEITRLLPTNISVFIAMDSTYGSSVDDVSAMHVTTDVLMYFGSDLSSSGSMPVIILPAIKELDVDEFLSKYNGLHFHNTDLTKSSSICLFYDPSYHDSVRKHYLHISDALKNKSSHVKFHLARLPVNADLDSWAPMSSSLRNTIDDSSSSSSSSSGSSSRISTHNDRQEILIGGLWIEKSAVAACELSSRTLVHYLPSEKSISVMRGDESKIFTHRSGAMLKVKDAEIIGIIIGSMGMTAETTQAIVHRLQLLIAESGRRHYTFAMGRINEAKLSNFPEIDLFVLIGNDDNALIPPKAFHTPVITPWELELGLGVREWESVFKTHSGAILEFTSGLSLEEAIIRARAERAEAQEDLEGNKTESGVEYEEGQTSQKEVGTIVKMNTNRELVALAEVGTPLYREREYKGLSATVSEERRADVTVHVGQWGLPTGYTQIQLENTSLNPDSKANL